MKSILVSGFGPFLNHKINVSQKLIEKLINEKAVEQMVLLPVEFKNSFQVLQEAIGDQSVDVVMFGLASGRNKISLETQGINWSETAHPDNQGFVPSIAEIVPGVDIPSIRTKMPWSKILDALPKQQQMRVQISNSTGSYVCNDLYFRFLYHFQNSSLRGGFIHLPEPTSEFDFEEIYSICLTILKTL